jgi:hypothetical protein
MQDTMAGSVATDETNRLIASDKVKGTAVYDRAGDRLGEVYNFMVDKLLGAGRVRGHVFRRLFRNRGEIPSPSLEGADLRHRSGRLCGRP